MILPTPSAERGSPSGASPGRSRLQSLLAAGRFALTAEITPPASSNLAELLAKARPLKGLADAVN